MLEHEHSLRAELDPAWAIPPVELTQYEGRNCSCPRGSRGRAARSTGRNADGDGSIPARCDRSFLPPSGSCTVGVSSTRTSKPAHVMVEPSTGHVWLMGFGDRLSIAARAPVGGTSRIHRGKRSPTWPPSKLEG